MNPRIKNNKIIILEERKKNRTPSAKRKKGSIFDKTIECQVRYREET